MQKQTRNHAALILAALLAGIAINLVVSVACSLWVPQRFRNTQTGLVWPGPVPRDWPDKPDRAGGWIGTGTDGGVASSGIVLVQVVQTPEFSLSVYRTGFPLRCFSAERYAVRTVATERWHWLPPSRFVVEGAPGVVALRPLLAGQAVNSAFYGSIAAGIILLAGRVRKSKRRPGMCRQCAYETLASVCPECGKTP